MQSGMHSVPRSTRKFTKLTSSFQLIPKEFWGHNYGAPVAQVTQESASEKRQSDPTPPSSPSVSTSKS